MLRISQLFIYPVKSLGGIALPRARLTDRGLEHDRRWMLVDAHNRFMTQRETPALARFHLSLTSEGIRISAPAGDGFLLRPDAPPAGEARVQIWNDTCLAILAGRQADEWFSHHLRMNCRLVHMPDSTHRAADPKRAPGSITSFSDDYPLLAIGQASLDDLNSRLAHSLPMNRFRPNIVIEGGAPYEEDELAHFRISGIDLFGVKLCARCTVITIDQENGHKGREPLATLATYRQFNKKVCFGQNLVHQGLGTLTVGDRLEVIERKKPAH